MLTTLAWNLSIEENQDYADDIDLDKIVQELASSSPELPTDECREILSLLIHRKKELFPDDSRFVLNVEVTEIDDGYYIQAASIL